MAYTHVAASGSPSFDSGSIGPRIGFNVPFADRLSLWPTVTLAYGTSWGQGAGVEDVWVEGYAPVIAQPVEHFFVGLGPYISYERSGARGALLGRESTYGISLTLGGWL